MELLTHRDYRNAIAVVADVCSERDPMSFRNSVVSRLAELIPSDVVSFNLAGPQGLIAVDEPKGTCSPALRSVLAHCIGEHPIVTNGVMSGDEGAYRLSDVRSQREFAASSLYTEFYAKLGLRYEMSFTVRCDARTSLTIGLDRTSRDYDNRELALFQLLAPHIATAVRRLREAEAHPCRASALASLAHLTPREFEILAIAATGKTNVQIAIEIGISSRTVQTHMESILRKLAVERRSAAAAAYTAAFTAPANAPSAASGDLPTAR